MTAEEIEKNLRQLRRGHGLRSHDVLDRLGRPLSKACGIVEEDAASVARRKLILRLSRGCYQLAQPLRHAALMALALDGSTDRQEYRFLHSRISALAVTFDRDTRTATRRVDQAFRLLAQLLNEDDDAEQVCAPDGWYTEVLNSTLRLDRRVPELTEERTIVATADELDEIVISLSAPQGSDVDSTSPNIAARMLYGGEIVEERRSGRSHAEFIVRLPEPLGLGEHHRYSVVLTCRERRHLRPYYVLTPWSDCAFFSARVKFDVDTPPQHVWRIDNLAPAVLNDFVPSDVPLGIDNIGEVYAEFHTMRHGRSYGIGWTALTAG